MKFSARFIISSIALLALMHSPSYGWQYLSILGQHTGPTKMKVHLGADNKTSRSLPKSSFLPSAAAAGRSFGSKFCKASKFLQERGLKGVLLAKLVGAKLVDINGFVQADHSEWQLFLVPRTKETWDKKGLLSQPAPGFVSEDKLFGWLHKQGFRSSGVDFLRGKDNPTFLGRITYGHQGAGLYKDIPDYAEYSGHRFKTRKVLANVIITKEQLNNALNVLYEELDGEYAKDGTCHQASLLFAREIGLDESELAKHITGSHWTRVLYGRTGR